MGKIEGWVILKNGIIVEKDKDLRVILKLSEKYEDDKITICKSSNIDFWIY